ncbi:hypothetical protein IE992_03685 [Klebsiella pneumoniae]|uniref:Uncharacterized protein n=3 Tax=Klebsiella pneumoniae TaxID=573 RepID=A0A927HVZ5_KLEPN|nr:hypothetical protein [Klebsiella pneumoniae]
MGTGGGGQKQTGGEDGFTRCIVVSLCCYKKLMRKTIDSSDDKNMTIQRQYYYLPNIAMLSEFCAIPVAKSHILY